MSYNEAIEIKDYPELVKILFYIMTWFFLFTVIEQLILSEVFYFLT